nr:unnamed protein product [Callosobruchus analis]
MHHQYPFMLSPMTLLLYQKTIECTEDNLQLSPYTRPQGGRVYIRILANKWRIFHRPLDVSLQFCDTIIKAACILHNFVRCKDGLVLHELFNVIVDQITGRFYQITLLLHKEQLLNSMTKYNNIFVGIVIIHVSICL